METQPIGKEFFPAIQAVASERDSAPESVLQLLQSACTTKISAVEELTMAMRSFARFPGAALSFASQAAVEARHLAMLTTRLHHLAGTLAPNLYGADSDDLLPGLKNASQGADALVEFVSHLYLNQHVRLNLLEESARSLEGDELTRKIVSRVAKDERQSLASIRALLDSISAEGPKDGIGAAREAAGRCWATIC